MSINHRNILCSFFVVIVALSSFIGLQAQTEKSKQTRQDWKKHEAETIDFARKYLISNLDSKLPQISFEEWFKSLFDDSAQIDWEINDCGEQTGTSADRGRDFPLCVSAKTQTAEFFYVSVNVQFGMFSSGISPEKPFLRDIMVGDLLDGEMFFVLSDLPKKIKSNLLKRQYLDPNGGVFIISGDKPAGFKNLNAMWLQTMAKNANLYYVPVKQNGGIKVGEKEYVTREVYFNGKNLSFTTVKVSGVSFKFEGEFAKLNLDLDGEILGENILQGRLTKFVRGRKAAAAKLSFSFFMTRRKSAAIADKEIF